MGETVKERVRKSHDDEGRTSRSQGGAQDKTVVSSKITRAFFILELSTRQVLEVRPYQMYIIARGYASYTPMTKNRSVCKKSAA